MKQTTDDSYLPDLNHFLPLTLNTPKAYLSTIPSALNILPLDFCLLFLKCEV